MEQLDFFRYASSSFSILENSPRLHNELSDGEVVSGFRDIERRLDARSKLKTFAAAHSYIAGARRKADSHFILLLNLREQKTTIEAFDSANAASVRYADLEKHYIDDELVDVVLVAAESIESAASAYPNYFVDISSFLTLVDGILNT